MPAWGGEWLRWMRNETTNGDWWHWCDACQCFADANHATGKWHIKKLPWYTPSEPASADAGNDAVDDDVGAAWMTSADSCAIARPARPAPPPRVQLPQSELFDEADEL
eukprot:2976521-Lingulodinium_polyedra.AAC.1